MRVRRKVIEIDEELCNGCGDCIPSCTEGAIEIVEGKARLVSETFCDGMGACLGECPLGAIRMIEREAEEYGAPHVGCPSAAPVALPPAGSSRLSHWPIQLFLVPPFAPFLRGADLLLAADCAPFARPGFHEDLLKGRAPVIACPKQEGFDGAGRLAEILRVAKPQSLTVAHMEVPCCFALAQWAQEAIQESGRDTPVHQVVIGVRGEIQTGPPPPA